MYWLSLFELRIWLPFLYRKSNAGRQYIGQQKKHKMTNNDLQNTTQETKDRAKRTPLQTAGTHLLPPHNRK